VLYPHEDENLVLSLYLPDRVGIKVPSSHPPVAATR
jgi:hypothetical protein